MKSIETSLAKISVFFIMKLIQWLLCIFITDIAR